MKKDFNAEDFAHLRQLIGFIKEESPGEQHTWNDRALVTIAMLRETFPKLDDNTLAGFCGAITYLISEVSFAKVADVGRMMNVIYMSYSLATAHLLGVYDAGDVSSVKVPERESEKPQQTGQYL